MNFSELLIALDNDKTYCDGSKRFQYQEQWNAIKNDIEPAYWPIIQDRIDLLATYH